MKTSKKIAARAARPAKSAKALPLAIKSILVPVDFSESSRKAVKYAIAFAKQFQARLVLLHVIEPVSATTFSMMANLAIEDDQTIAVCKAQLMREAKTAGVKASLLDRVLVRQGRSYAEICDAAGTLKVDLIIVSTHGFTGLKHTLLGSTAERVVRHAPCPVLVVRSNERDFLKS